MFLHRNVGCALAFSVACITSPFAQAQFPGGSAPGVEGLSDAVPASEKSFILPGVPGATATDTPGQASANFCQCVGESDPAAVTRIEQALRSPLRSSGLNFTAQPLGDVLNAIQEEYAIPVRLDTTALESIGVDADEQVTISLHNISLRSALRLMLKHLQLTYIISDEVVLITTPEEAEKDLVTCVYDVHDLVSKSSSDGSKTATVYASFDELIDAVTECVAKDTWSENGGGAAAIRPLGGGVLVVSQTRAIHEQIRDLLNSIRKAKAEATLAASRVGASEFDPSAAGLASAGPSEVVTRAYTLQLNPTDDTKTQRQQIEQFIAESLPDEVWSGRLPDGQTVSLAVLHDRIVARQMPEVQEKLQRVLTDSGIASPSTTVATGLRRGFGGGGMEGGFGGEVGASGGGGGFFSPANNRQRSPHGAPNPFE